MMSDENWKSINQKPNGQNDRKWKHILPVSGSRVMGDGGKVVNN